MDKYEFGAYLVAITGAILFVIMMYCAGFIDGKQKMVNTFCSSDPYNAHCVVSQYTFEE